MLSWSLILLTLACLSALFGFGLSPEQAGVSLLRVLAAVFLVAFVVAFLRERRVRR